MKPCMHAGSFFGVAGATHTRIRTTSKPAHLASGRPSGFSACFFQFSIVTAFAPSSMPPPWSSRPSCNTTSRRAEDYFVEEHRPPMFSSSNHLISPTRRGRSHTTSSTARAIIIIDPIFPMPILVDRCALIACAMLLLDECRRRPSQ